MELTKQHIQSLYDFVEQHKVEYYDLQTELVDHLANDIEQIWEKEPNLSFEQARYKATIKFGLKGFSTFVSQREKTMKKENWKWFRHHFVAFFSFPKIMITLFFTAIIYLGFDMVTDKSSFLVYSITAIYSIAFIYALYLTIKLKVRKRKTGKRWLFEDIVIKSNSVLLFTVLVQPYQFYNYFLSDITINGSITIQLLYTFGIVLISLLFYITLWVIPPKFEATIKKHDIAQ